MAAAGIVLRDLLTVPARPARVLAAFPSAVYLQVEEDAVDPARARARGVAGAGSGVLALLTRDAVRLPLGFVVDADAAGAPFAGLVAGDEALVGDGRIRCRAGSWQVRRWWDSRVPVVARVPGPTPPAPDPGSLDDAVLALVGAGPGLTPAGDDVLCAVLAALAATGDGVRGRALAGVVLRHAHRTTTLSAALLRCAAAGHGLPQLTRLLTAVLSEDTPDRRRRALADLLAVGHTSGAALAAGALLTLRCGATPCPHPLTSSPSPLSAPPLSAVIMHARATLAGLPGASAPDHAHEGGTDPAGGSPSSGRPAPSPPGRPAPSPPARPAPSTSEEAA